MDCDIKIKEERLDCDKDRGRERERSRRDRPSRFSSGGRDRSPIRDRRRHGDRRVYVSNVAYESRWQDVKDLFRAEVGEVTYVELFVDENDRPRGCGVVEFETPELAAKAVEKMHRFDVKGRKLVVKEDIDVERDKYGRPVPNRNRGGGDREQPSSSSSLNRGSREDVSRSVAWDGGNSQSSAVGSENVSSGNHNSASKFGNTYGLSPQFLESLWITGPLVSKVFVANLDYKVDDKKLREVFKLAGRVLHAEISIDKEAKSRGFGVVEYEHPVEAVQAISLLHNQVLYDRRLTVRMDRVDKIDGPPKLPDGLKGIGMGLGANGTILTDVSRNLPSLNNNPPLAGIASNVHTLQAAAAAAQQAAQVAQAAQLGHTSLNPVNQSQLAGLAGTNPLSHSLAGVGSLLAQSLNVSAEQLASTLNANPNFGNASLNSAQPLNAALGAGLPSSLSQALNPNIASGIGPGIGGGLGNNSLSNSTGVFLGASAPNPAAFGAGYGSGRDFDSMSAAFSSSTAGNYSPLRVGSSNVSSNFNGSSRPVGEALSNAPQSSSGSRGGSDTVIIKNLPPNLSWSYLREKLRDIGDVKFAEMRSKDTGIIRFSNEWEAERADQNYDLKSSCQKVIQKRGKSFLVQFFNPVCAADTPADEKVQIVKTEKDESP